MPVTVTPSDDERLIRWAELYAEMNRDGEPLPRWFPWLLKRLREGAHRLQRDELELDSQVLEQSVVVARSEQDPMSVPTSPGQWWFGTRIKGGPRQCFFIGMSNGELAVCTPSGGLIKIEDVAEWHGNVDLMAARIAELEARPGE